jgi:hypothetical protein
MYSNTNLEKLSLKSNNIGDEGLCAMVECLLTNSTINNFYAWGNKFDKDSCVAVKSLLDKKRILPNNTDLQPYFVDGQVFLGEVSNGINNNYYWKPHYGLSNSSNSTSAK